MNSDEPEDPLYLDRPTTDFIIRKAIPRFLVARKTDEKYLTLIELLLSCEHLEDAFDQTESMASNSK